MNFRSQYLPLIGAAVLSLSASVPAQAFSEAAFQTAFTHLMNSHQSEQAAAAFTALQQSEPGNPLLLAYRGASTAKRAADTIFPWKKMTYAEEGMAMLDKALQLTSAAPAMHGSVPQQLEVKLTAANTFLAVPGFMHRAAQAKQLINDILSDTRLAATPLAFRAAVWWCAAQQARSEKNLPLARNYLNDIISHHAEQSAQAVQLLKELN